MGPPTPFPAGGAVPAAESARCIRDLLDLLTLPDRWSDRDPRALLEILFDALSERLRLDFAYAFIHTARDEIEVFRIGLGGPAVEALRRALESTLWSKGAKTQRIECHGTHYQAAFLSLGGEVGVMVLGSRRQDFPTISERVLLAAGRAWRRAGSRPPA